MAFQEFTFSEPYSNLELMVDIDIDTLKVIDCYTYIKDIEEIDQFDDDLGLTRHNWKVGKNPLFGHNKNAAMKIFSGCYVSVETEEEVEFLFKVAKKNNFNTGGISLN